MIDRTHELPIVRQCRILELSRSTAYYQPGLVSPDELALMRRIDELHLEHPFAGARMLSRMLKREDQPVGRRRVSTLMKRMEINALYRKPSTSKRHPAHKVYPYLLRNLTITRSNQVWSADITFIHSDEAWFRIFIRRTGLVKPPGAVVARLQYADHRLLHGSRTGSDQPLWQAGHFQHRPRVPVHQP
jgi:putative transposase